MLRFKICDFAFKMCVRLYTSVKYAIKTDHYQKQKQNRTNTETEYEVFSLTRI